MKYHSSYFFLMLVMCTLFFLMQNSFATPIDKVIVFGDSLSDSGNMYGLTKKVKRIIPFIPLIPKSPPYYDGRFTNGKVWVEDVAERMNVELENHAYGGAWAESVFYSLLLVPFGLELQVSMYLVGARADTHKDNHLYIIWAGGNDYVNGRYDYEFATSNVVSSIKEQLSTLIYYGAKNIIVVNLPDLGRIPYVTKEGPVFAKAISKLAALHNQKLEKMVSEMKSKYSKVKLVYFAADTFFKDVSIHPEKYGIKNVDQPCYAGSIFFLHSLQGNTGLDALKEKANIDVLNSPALKTAYIVGMSSARGYSSCPNPDEYVFWDGMHPTRMLHSIFSVLALDKFYELGFKGQAA